MVRDTASSTFVFLSSRQRLTMGRIERRMLRVMAALLEGGSTVALICPPRSPMASEARVMGVEVAAYPLDALNFIRTRSRVRKYLERYRPVVVHSTGLEADLIARWASRGMSTAAVNTIPCIDWPRRGPSGLSRAVRRWLDNTTLEDADAIVVDCAPLVSRLVEQSIPAERILFDPPSIDIGEVLAQAEAPYKGFDRPNGPLVGYGGRMEPGRGLQHLVAASAILDARGVLVDVIIAGDGPLLRELQADVRSSRVKYSGFVESIPSVLKHMAVAVFPSVEPGVPTSLLEAAALGRPIVASRVEGITGLYEEGTEIRLVQPGDAKALAVAIAEMIGDPEKAAAMGERARLRTIDEYSSSASIERHMELYSRLKRG